MPAVICLWLVTLTFFSPVVALVNFVKFLEYAIET